MKEFRAIVSGRVQMVMFRDFVQRHARKYWLTGTVHNFPDGTVEVIAQGSEEALKKFAADLHKGPFLARVDTVALEWRESQKAFDSFEIVQ